MSYEVLRRQIQALEARIVQLEATLARERSAAVRPPRLRLLRVHAAYTFNGEKSLHKYVVKCLLNPESAAPIALDGDLSMPEAFTLLDGDTTAIGIDVAANGTPDNQIRTFPAYRLGYYVGILAPERGRTSGGEHVYAFVGNGDFGVFVVNLAGDGGTDGDGTTEPTYTYTVTRDGTELGTEMSPSVGRTEGSFEEATLGLGCYLAGTFTLLIAFEKPATFEQDCEEEAP